MRLQVEAVSLTFLLVRENPFEPRLHVLAPSLLDDALEDVRVLNERGRHERAKELLAEEEAAANAAVRH